MKQLLFSLTILFASLTINASDIYYKVEVHFHDETVRSGLAKRLKSTSDNFVFFKESENAEIEKIESKSIKKLIFINKHFGDEYAFLNTYKETNQAKIGNPMWMNVTVRGKATLYVTSTTTIRNGSSTTFTDYYIIREGEPAARKISAIGDAGNNRVFRARAPIYFADYPELAAKIKNKEYTWKDIISVVTTYNKWAENKDE